MSLKVRNHGHLLWQSKSYCALTDFLCYPILLLWRWTVSLLMLTIFKAVLRGNGSYLWGLVPVFSGWKYFVLECKWYLWLKIFSVWKLDLFSSDSWPTSRTLQLFRVINKQYVGPLSNWNDQLWFTWMFWESWRYPFWNAVAFCTILEWYSECPVSVCRWFFHQWTAE